MDFTLKKIRVGAKLFRRAFAAYKPQLAALVVLGFLSGLLESVGVNAVIPVFSFITDTESLPTDVISRAIKGIFTFLSLPYSLPALLIFICVLFVIKALALVAFNYLNIRITTDYEKETRSVVFAETLQAGWPYLLKQKSGYVEQVILTDISRGASLLRHVSGTILLSTSLFTYTLVAFNISWFVTLLTLGIGGALFLLISPLFSATRNSSNRQAALTKAVAHTVSEHLLGAKTVKASGTEQSVIAKARGQFEELRSTSTTVSFIAGVINALQEPVGIIFIVSVFALSIRQPGFTFASFAVVLYLIQKIFSYIQIAQSRVVTINELLPYLATAVEYRDEARDQKETTAGTAPFQFLSNLSLQKVSFAYTPDKPILSGISLQILKGQMIGLIGPSGAGKTTLVDLLLRLFQPTGGTISVDATDVTAISLNDWRTHISYVSQDLFLLNDTVANNIAFYREEITEAELITAARLANIYDFIQALPLGFQTQIGERGVLLSGGQRQRIVLARALLRKPEILVLDEATSALDNESEVLVQQAIENLKGKVTTVVIAHRLSTVLSCDQLFVVENGRITEQGSPAELLKDKDSYFFKTHHIHGQQA